MKLIFKVGTSYHRRNIKLINVTHIQRDPVGIPCSDVSVKSDVIVNERNLIFYRSCIRYLLFRINWPDGIVLLQDMNFLVLAHKECSGAFLRQ